jgi:hypothetical protein
MLRAVVVTVALALGFVVFASAFPIFVGKGDVQTALGLNNSALQSATIVFTLETSSATIWECNAPATKEGNPDKEAFKMLVVTSSGLTSSTARVKNQITGYWIDSFSGTETETKKGYEIEADVPKYDDKITTLGYCKDGWTLDAESFVTETGGAGSIKANGVALYQ